MREVLKAGARGYVLKNDVSRVLVQAVESLSLHRPFFTSKVGEVLLKGFGRNLDASESAASNDPLTSREREVLQRVAEGRSTKEVAQVLNISAKTAENHRTNLMRKLKVKSAAGLVRYAVRNKIITA